MSADDLVEIRLSEERFVAFVVPIAAVADNIDDDVAAKLLTVGDRDTGRLGDGNRVVSVDMENRCLDGLRDLGAVECRA